MTKELVINTTSHETRVALLENGHIAELYIERSRERGGRKPQSRSWSTCSRSGPR
jgi:Ribonuclease G/E